MPDESMLVFVDATRIIQVLGNLLTNAAKYTPDKGHIALSVRREERQAVISISDSGIGIAAEAMPKLFEMFSQLPNNAGRTQGGLGIGLSLVHRLVEMHGGTVDASSPGEGRGSSFIVRLPLADARKEYLVASMAGMSPADRVGRSFKVLIADDNTDAAESFAAILDLGGHETLIAHDGHDSLRLALESRPEVVFLDIGMPGLTGYEVARMIRATPGMESAVLVALTGWGTQHDQARAREAGFDHHLTKPADIRAINALLAGVAHGR